jgi:hypothetical protein
MLGVLARIGCVAFLAGAASSWLLATGHRAAAPLDPVAAKADARWPMAPEHARAIRNDALRRARTHIAVADVPRLDLQTVGAPFSCRFVAEMPTGTSPKFDCTLRNGDVVKVKYGRNPEVAAEVAATRLLSALGYHADRMTIVPRVRCHGCPRHPFYAMHLLRLTGLHSRFPPHGDDEGYSEFEWVAVERKLEAMAVELPDSKGWAWWELDAVDPALGASRVDLDALRLVAVFLAHWDNKAENQRLVCLDTPTSADQPCQQPLLVLQDLGATFGPLKANLAGWRSAPLWTDRATCTVSMKSLPFGGGTFPDAAITEAARLRVAGQLSAISGSEVRGLFRAARFPEYYSTTNDEKDVAAWAAAFRMRVEEIATAGPCPQ